MKTKVIMPIGWLAGQEIDLPYALSLLSTEAMGARSDIQEWMRKKQASAAEELGALEFQFERVAFALAVIAWQLKPEPTSGYIEQARRLAVTLPPGFPDDEDKIPKNTNFVPGKNKDFLSD